MTGRDVLPVSLRREEEVFQLGVGSRRMSFGELLQKKIFALGGLVGVGVPDGWRGRQ